MRRSFTVETKARGRQAPAILPVRAPLLEQPSIAFPSLEAAALFGGEPAKRVEDGAAPAGRPAPRRILPSLIEPPAPVLEEEAEPAAREARLPRVRRVKLPRAAAAPARAESSAMQADPAHAERVSTLPAPAKPKSADPAEPARRTIRRSEKVLPLGERWKRRLPRVCW
ncbi:hypothetical protein DK427_22550 [Methylobacterium radiodurans]|uniref:Uncharacterized protein n=1 Tax=Methylobacterium radiodurans TaxID=2202828 RepID=A0A2U8VY28_9HYPH|nr:hypothetical protein DK427_22550 [Methylobacterium radiodurans]